MTGVNDAKICGVCGDPYGCEEIAGKVYRHDCQCVDAEPVGEEPRPWEPWMMYGDTQAEAELYMDDLHGRGRHYDEIEEARL